MKPSTALAAIWDGAMVVSGRILYKLGWDTPSWKENVFPLGRGHLGESIWEER